MEGMTTIRYDETYRPGACNIGRREVAQRRLAGIVGLGIAAVLAVALVAAGSPVVLRWLVAVPLAGGLIGLLQARNRFCVNYAVRGVSNFGSPDDTVRIADEAARAADRRAAIRLIATTAVASIAATAVFVLLPV